MGVCALEKCRVKLTGTMYPICIGVYVILYYMIYYIIYMVDVLGKLIQVIYCKPIVALENTNE